MCQFFYPISTDDISGRHKSASSLILPFKVTAGDVIYNLRIARVKTLKLQIKASNFISVSTLLCYLCHIGKGQLNSEWIYEVIVSPKTTNKYFKDFCPGSLLEGRAEILKIFGWNFGRNDDIINSFWI